MRLVYAVFVSNSIMMCRGTEKSVVCLWFGSDEILAAIFIGIGPYLTEHVFLKILKLFFQNPREASSRSRIFLISLVYGFMYVFICLFVSRLLAYLKMIQT